VVDRPRVQLAVADSSALIALATCDALNLLELLARKVRVPEAVWHEVVVEGKPQAETLRRYLEKKVEAVRREDFIVESGSLDAGELEAMALFKKLEAGVLVVDEDRARKVARLNRIPIVGSLGVLLLGKRKGAIPTVRPAVDKLRKSDLFMGEALLRKTLALASEE